MLKRLALVLSLAYVLALSTSLIAQNDPLIVVATNTIIADVAQNVAGDLITVTSLVPTDTDIHAFQPTPSDVDLASRADLVLVNGIGLEAFLGDLLQGAVDDPSRIIVVSNGIQVLGAMHDHQGEAISTTEPAATAEANQDYVGVVGVDAACGDLLTATQAESTQAADDSDHGDHGPCDPHVWTDPTNVKIWADTIAAAFATLDPSHAETYIANADAYKTQLEALDSEVTDILSVIPSERRIMVTNHDFLRYFARHYQIEIVGAVIPSVSSLAEPAPQELAALVETIKGQGVRAIFAEASDPAQLAQVVADEVGSTVMVATLYSDSLSADGPAATYIDYVRVNAQTIAEALK